MPIARPEASEWVDKLTTFKDFVRNLRLPDADKPSVKVALLDNGCKLQVGGLDGTQIGRSFRPDNQQYFVGPCEHGTFMAYCIRDVCPMAELYIARLDDSREKENENFTIASCYEASCLV